MGAAKATGGRVRQSGARLLTLAGGAAFALSRRVESGGAPTLQGDRSVEWSFCIARLAEGPGSTLDFGADTGFLSLAAAQRGHDVVALDRGPSSLEYSHEQVTAVQADILDRPLADRRFDQIVNCSSVEHVGLVGRYGSTDRPDGDIEAMSILPDLLSSGGRMILTVPVGRDLVCPPLHRIYGPTRLPRLLEGYMIEEEQYWAKSTTWKATDRQNALATPGSRSFYSLGLFILRSRP
jgi:SAM-dependent methyltransferase